ncbi:MAG: mycofactocin system glycosyltransferase, partial [Deltaproteobacteria bacterium]|nr:mycofactocin system glycosyltransferase [Deltaproteobacteria bacterium]
ADALWARARLARRRVPVGWARVTGARLRALGSLAYYLGAHGVRYYGLPMILAGVLWPAAGALGLAVLAGVGWVEHRTRRPALPYPVFLALYAAENLAYGLGVLWGCGRKGSFSSYRPVVYRRMEMPLG